MPSAINTLWLAGDKPDLRYAVTLLASAVHQPTAKDWGMLKEERPGGWNPTKGDVGKDRPSLKAVNKAKREEEEIVASAFADSDWGTCKESRRSYFVGVILLMGAYVCGWTRKQTCVALSSAEAERIALTTGLSEGTYVRNLLCELVGFDSEAQGSIPLHGHMDSEAARCLALRAGVIPKVKHLGIRALHCQQVFEEGRAHLHKLAAVSIPADLFTKSVTVEVMHRLLPLLKLRLEKGLAGVAIASLATGTGAEAVLFGTLHSSGILLTRSSVAESTRGSPEENSYDLGQWTVHDAANDVLGILPRLVLWEEMGREGDDVMSSNDGTFCR
eukprot:6475689-Amphidinium_carterae.1